MASRFQLLIDTMAAVRLTTSSSAADATGAGPIGGGKSVAAGKIPVNGSAPRAVQSA